MKFKLLVGWHSGVGPSGPNHVYKSTEPGNNVVESDIDLVAHCGAEKFAKIDQDYPSETNDSLETLTVPELKKFAQNENIDLGNASKKDEIIRAIREALDS